MSSRCVGFSIGPGYWSDAEDCPSPCRLAPKRIVVLGGQDAVPDAVLEQARGLLDR